MNRTDHASRRSRTGPTWAIALKDMRALKASLQLWLPMLIVPLMFGGILPAVFVLLVRFYVLPAGPEGLERMGDMGFVLELMRTSAPPALQAELATLPGDIERVLYFGLTYLLAPMFLLIPVMAASIITANSFAGEKERKTLEGLLYAPISMNQLLIGKALSAFLPALGLTLGSFVLYGTVVNTLAYPIYGRLIFPTWNWLPLMGLVVPALTAVIVLATMIVSAKVKGFQEAYQLGGILVLPVLALTGGQATGLLLLGSGAMLVMGAALAAIAWLLLRSARRLAKRHQFLEKLG
ncbi:ABC transporter permease subunit [Paenibacillus albicereus]|uniref:ABC transporter permease subunit n=1 Tax=Paenibacillus albicereus TaxID=2726185 RepID=A0A6H2H1V7_9BACL|nr:ABC transporter permease subunit [Paenibacillus albicereus]QJC53396.1 ABC transporter permease subunit [Paenibacillus albicereus]